MSLLDRRTKSLYQHIYGTEQVLSSNAGASCFQGSHKREHENSEFGFLIWTKIHSSCQEAESCNCTFMTW